MATIIGISGKMGVGKTRLACTLCDLHPGWVRMAFGDPVKDEISEVFGFSRRLCNTALGKSTGVSTHQAVDHPGAGGKLPPRLIMTVREVLQWWGTDVRRAQDPDYWVKAMAARLDDLPGDACVVFDDVRFPNEARMVRERGGLLVRLLPWNGWKPGPNADHYSECALDGYDDWDAVHLLRLRQMSDAARALVPMAYLTGQRDLEAQWSRA